MDSIRIPMYSMGIAKDPHGFHGDCLRIPMDSLRIPMDSPGIPMDSTGIP